MPFSNNDNARSADCMRAEPKDCVYGRHQTLLFPLCAAVAATRVRLYLPPAILQGHPDAQPAAGSPAPLRGKSARTRVPCACTAYPTAARESARAAPRVTFKQLRSEIEHAQTCKVSISHHAVRACIQPDPTRILKPCVEDVWFPGQLSPHPTQGWVNGLRV